MTWWKRTRSIVLAAIDEWIADGVPGRGAAPSYYVLFSLGPLLVLPVGVFELFLSGAATRDSLAERRDE